MSQGTGAVARDEADGEPLDPRWPLDRLDQSRYPDGIELPVFYNDLDTNAHINNVALGRYFEHGRYDAHRRHRINVALPPGNFLSARVAIDYLAEGRVGRPLSVRMRVARIGRTSVVEEQGAWQNGTCIGLAESVLVYVVNGRPAPIPPDLRAICETLVEPTFPERPT